MISRQGPDRLVMFRFPCNRIDAQRQTESQRVKQRHDRPADRDSPQGRPHHHFHHPSRARRPASRHHFLHGRAGYPRGTSRHGTPAGHLRLLRDAAQYVLPLRRHGAGAAAGRSGSARAQAHVPADGLDQHSPGDGGYKGAAGLCRRPVRRPQGYRRHRRLLHERTIRRQRRDAFPRTGQGRGLDLRRTTGHRPARQSASRRAKGQGRTLFRLRRDRCLRADGERQESKTANEGRRRQCRSRDLSRHPSRLRVSEAAGLRSWRRRAALGTAAGALSPQSFVISRGSMPFLTIAFPVFDPIAIAIGPIAIRWYALAYIGGIVLGWIYARALIKSTKLWGGPAPITLLQMDDFILWVTVGIILGGRTGYVLFYNLPFFIQHPAEIFELWKGGMSFHGGFLRCVAAVIPFCPANGLSRLSLGEIPTLVGRMWLFLGGLATFINSELWDRPADESVPWAMVFPNGGPLPRHPSQLYEAGLEGILLFTILAVMIRMGALKRPGLILGSFIALYGVARIIGEFFREPDPQLGFLLGGLTMGMLLSVPMIVAGAIIIVLAWRRKAPTREPVSGQHP